MPDGQHHYEESRLALIVDDSQMILDEVGGLLEQFGFIVITSVDGEAGLSMCLRHRPVFLLLDWDLPGLSGPEFLKALRAVPGGERTRVFLCGGNARPRDIHLAMAAGADEYLLKPFDQELLTFKLCQAGLLTRQG